jgi:toxin YoeB
VKKIKFEQEAFEDYNNWASQDIKTFRKISKLITEIQKNHFAGSGKPEPLKHNFQGCWSRHITDEHRLVYKITNEEIIIISCKYHY